MSAVNVTSVRVQNNPASYLAPIAFEIEYECLTALADDLEWRMTYVGSAESEDYDQLLDSILVGPVYAGMYRFVFESNPPDPALLPPDDVVGVSVILLTCCYRGKEFIRIGYYVNCEYTEEELRENNPEKPIIELLRRHVLEDHPRVTRFPVDFDGPAAAGVDGGPAPGVGEPSGCDAAMLDDAGGQQLGGSAHLPDALTGQALGRACLQPCPPPQLGRAEDMEG